MKNTNFSLFLVVFVSLVCISAPGIDLAQFDLYDRCSHVEPDVDSETLPVIETIPAADLAQFDPFGPCCNVEPGVGPV